MAKVFLRTYLRHILLLYDLLSGGGVGGGILRKKRFVDACVFHFFRIGPSGRIRKCTI